jgi:hypothetical protein
VGCDSMRFADVSEERRVIQVRTGKEQTQLCFLVAFSACLTSSSTLKMEAFRSSYVGKRQPDYMATHLRSSTCYIKARSAYICVYIQAHIEGRPAGHRPPTLGWAPNIRLFYLKIIISKQEYWTPVQLSFSCYFGISRFSCLLASEKCISVMKRGKVLNRSAVFEERLNGLSILHMNSDVARAELSYKNLQ